MHWFLEPPPAHQQLWYWLCKVDTLQWCHNGQDGVSNHQPHNCLLNHLFKAQIKENTKAPRHWPLYGECTGDGEFPTQRAGNAENVSISWCHHEVHSCLPWRISPTYWHVISMPRSNMKLICVFMFLYNSSLLVHSLILGDLDVILKNVIFTLVSLIDIFKSYDNALRWMP